MVAGEPRGRGPDQLRKGGAGRNGSGQPKRPDSSGPTRTSSLRRNGRPLAIAPSQEFVLATNAIVFLARHRGYAAPMEELGRALGVRPDDPVICDVLVRLGCSGIVQSEGGARNAVRLLVSPGELTLAQVAEAVGERLLPSSEAERASVDGSDVNDMFSGIWREILAGFETMELDSLAHVQEKAP